MAAEGISKDQNGVSIKVETLTEQVQRIVLHKLGTGAHTLCAQVLEKRKRKWRKRQAVNVDSVSEAAPVDQYKMELESLVSACWDQQIRLACTRREGLETVKRLRVEKWDHCLQAIRYRLAQTKLTFEDLCEEQVSSPPKQAPIQNIMEHQTILDLQAAIARAKSVQTIRSMKLYETPCIPILSNKTSYHTSPLKALHLNTSVSHESASTSHTPVHSSSLGTNSLPDHIEDTIDCNNNCNIPVVMTTEISTTSLHPHDTAPPEEPLSMPITFMPPEPTLTPYLSEITTDFQRTSDTPLHVGMEVVCHGESMASSITEDSDVMVESSGGVAHIPTHQDTNDTPLPRANKRLRTPGSKTRRCSNVGSHKKRHSKGVIESPAVQSIPLNSVVSDDEKKIELSDTDTDSDSHMRKLLEVLERAPYNLRVPQKNSGDSLRYSFTNGVTVTASAKKKRRKPGTPKQK